MTSAENDFWEPQTDFLGQTVFVVGGGPSLRGFDFSVLRDRRVIAVNSSAYDLPFADVLFFHDNSWLNAPNNHALVESWKGRVISPSRLAKKSMPEKIMRIACAKQRHFLVGQSPVKIGLSSGQTAISLAIAMGAEVVVLLGFDMRSDDGKSHYHVGRQLYTAEHTASVVMRYEDYFLKGFCGWNDCAVSVGCLVVNATPGSLLTEFPAGDLRDFL